MRKLLRSVISTVILAFAIYAFVNVPIGRRTGFGHVKAILSTKAASDAAADARSAALKTGQAIIPHETLPKVDIGDPSKPGKSTP